MAKSTFFSEDVFLARSTSQAPGKANSVASELATEMTWTPVSVFQKSVAGGAAQETYSPRFVAYFARFLLNYDRCDSRALVARVC